MYKMKNIDIEKLMVVIMEQAQQSKLQAEQTAQHALAVYEQYKDMQEIKFEMRNLKGEMLDFRGEMLEFKDKMDNHIFLSPAESNEMSSQVDKKSVNFADYLNDIGYYPNAKDFGDIIRRVKISIRAMLRIKFKCQRWYMIRHKDYEDAMSYLESMNVRDFLNYRNRKVIKITNTQANKSVS